MKTKEEKYYGSKGILGSIGRTVFSTDTEITIAKGHIDSSSLQPGSQLLGYRNNCSVNQLMEEQDAPQIYSGMLSHHLKEFTPVISDSFGTTGKHYSM